MGRPVEMTIEFTDLERPRRLASLTRLPTMEIQGALSFDPVSEGTRMRWVTLESAVPIASTNASQVRTSALHKSPLTFEKACSMGL